MLLFSIIIPTFNRSHTIMRAVESCLRQSYENYEIIIVDDGSSDDTRDVIADVINPRVKYFQIENVERGAARNFGISKSKGDYVTFLDSDDLYYSSYLENANKWLAKRDIAFFFQGFEFITDEKKVFKSYQQRIPKELEVGNFLACIGVFVRRDLFEKDMFEDNREMAGSEDYELWLRLYSKHGLVVCNDVFAAMVHHSERSELNIKSHKLKSRIRLLVSKVDQNVQLKTNLDVRKVVCNIYLYAAISHIEIKELKDSIINVFNAIKKDPRALYYYKTHVVLYNISKLFAKRIFSIK